MENEWLNHQLGMVILVFFHTKFCVFNGTSGPQNLHDNGKNNHESRFEDVSPIKKLGDSSNLPC